MKRLVQFVVTLLTLSYTKALTHHTLQPISRICEHQDDPGVLRGLLVKFAHTKEKEMSFVTAAVSCASNPTTTNCSDMTPGPRIHGRRGGCFLLARGHHHILGSANGLALQPVVVDRSID
jgi:hypothetical protein